MHEVPYPEYVENDILVSLDREEKGDLDMALMVNSDLVDNEFTGRDVFVSFSWRN